MSTLPRLERQRSDFLKSISNSGITLSYLFGIETTNTMMHYRSFLENHTRFQTKTGEVRYPFSDRNSLKNNTLWGCLRCRHSKSSGLDECVGQLQRRLFGPHIPTLLFS